jgi:endonuclease/exonuclease/phosphatase family metal-dependent hydrolase
VDVRTRGKNFTFIDTHLEAFSAAAQEAQSVELLAGPASTSKPVVMAGDFNSPADGSGSDSYGNIVAAGFLDAWAETMPGDPGYTCCHSDDLMSAAGDLNSRIDIIFFGGTDMDATEAEIVGEAEADKTLGGLWPSDHAGVLSTVTFGAMS